MKYIVYKNGQPHHYTDNRQEAEQVAEAVEGDLSELVRIQDLKAGDTALTEGDFKTLSSYQIKRAGFMRATLNGNPHIETGGMVERQLFRKWVSGVIVAWKPQL